MTDTMSSRRITTANLYNDPFFIGFDNLVSKLHNQVNNAGNYPPYNIIKTGEYTYVVEMAVAGFSIDELDITLQDGALTVEGKPLESVEMDYLHKGIATRAFTRKFTLADTIEVRNADLVNGMLKIELENVIPEAKKPRKIAIASKLQEPQFLSEYDGSDIASNES